MSAYLYPSDIDKMRKIQRSMGGQITSVAAANLWGQRRTLRLAAGGYIVNSQVTIGPFTTTGYKLTQYALDTLASVSLTDTFK